MGRVRTRTQGSESLFSALSPHHSACSWGVFESRPHLEEGHLRGQNVFQHDHWNIFLYETHLGIPYLLGGMIPGTLAGIVS